MSGDLRGRLNELVDGLANKGFETQTWTPDAKQTNEVSESRTSVGHDASAILQTQVSSTFQSQNETRNFNQGEQGKGGPHEEQSGGRQQNREGREQRQQNERQEKPKNIFRTILEGARP